MRRCMYSQRGLRRARRIRAPVSARRKLTSFLRYCLRTSSTTGPPGGCPIRTGVTTRSMSRGCFKEGRTGRCSPGRSSVSEWEYRKIALNQLSAKTEDVDLLNNAGEEGWEL